ncbi:MAG: ABC transporter ATP-binding protein [Microcella sp.]|uniref:dipeptide ABC transporter ATP-binding protein n=1 Tax=Microcella sp. TaxID=1913979 RepID=UPI0024C5096C|nr:ABC transporter ATP-binding protein [Microcella sp.]UYN84096.1 MAG: ABC transporter ATP-binding protein [Microcella sp.]
MSEATPLLQARGLTVHGPSGIIVEPLDLDVHAGRTLAIVGESGSGKSLTARALTGLLDPALRAAGSVQLGERQFDLGADVPWRRLRGSAVSLLLQDPFTSLSPVHRCGSQIADTVRASAQRSHVTLSRRRVDAIVAERLAEVGLDPAVARRYPHELSGGMRQRVAIAAAIAGDPEILIADEPTTALDSSTRGEVLAVIAELQSRRGLGVILISHDLGVVRGCADDLIVMYAGSAVERGPAAVVLDQPVHPYTERLLAAEPPLDHRLHELAGIPGSVPSPGSRAEGCSFAPRCALATDLCRIETPPLRVVATGALAACHHSSEPIVSTDRAAASARSLDERPDTVLSVRGLRARHGATEVLHGVDLIVGSREIVGVVGESGSGKTTLARCIAGLHTDHDGDLRLDGVTLPRGLSGRDPRSLQIVFQDPYSALNPRLAVGAVLREALAVGERPPSDLGALLDSVGLPAHYARKRPRDLSGGERQRVAIARALAPRPRLLICDESVSALDVSVQAQILSLLLSIRDELSTPVLFITHDLAVVRQVCDRVLVLRNGEAVESGMVDLVFDEPEHPYTRSLLVASAPVPDVKGATLT